MTEHRNTRQRGAVTLLLTELGEFRSAQELHAMLREQRREVVVEAVVHIGHPAWCARLASEPTAPSSRAHAAA